MKTLCVLLLCVFHIANSQIFPIGQVIEYDYEAFVQVATEYPSLHTSEFLINAKLYITGINNGAFVSFKDVTHTVYTGKGDKLYTNSNKIGLDQESQLLMNPFVIIYDRNGKVENILTDRSDMPWSVNIKKGIASMLQIDVPQVIYGKNNGFYTKEQTVHGNCMIQYAVTPGPSGNLKVFKHHNTFSCEEFKFNRFLDLFSPRCDNRRGEVLTVSSERFYDIQFMRDELDINHIESFNSIIFNPFYNNDQNIFVNQTLDKLSKRELNEELRFDVNVMIPHRLKNEVMNFDLDEEIYDISGGRQFVNQELVMQKAMESLKNIFNYIHQNHILLTEVIKDQKQGMNFLFHQIKLMNLQTLDHFYKTISEEKGEDTEDLVELFLQALPFAGSYPSTIFIRDLIMESRVSDKIAIKMLQDVPFYVKNINKKVLGEFFEILNGKDLSKQVMKSTLLTFASMVNLGIDRYGENDIDMENYIYFYLDKFEQARDQESQTLFMHTLKNLGSNKVAFYLENLLIVGRPGIYLTPHSKVQAMWAIRTYLIQRPGKVSTMYWPMLVDQNESFEVRATALQILLLTATTSTHMKIYWFMQSVTDYDLHNYYYTVLVESTKITGSCYNTNMQRARNMLRFVRKPRNPSISQAIKLAQLADLFDAYYGFGLLNQILAMGNLGTKGFVWIHAQQSPQVEDMESVKQSMQLYIKISENLQKLIQNRQTDIDINQLFMTSMKPNDLELEIVKVRRGRILTVINHDMGTMRIAYEKSKERRESSKGIVNYEMDQFVGEEILIPTDLGVPVSLFYQMPSMRMTKINFGSGQADKGTMNWKFTYDNLWWYQHKTGLAVYNPVANLWHGSRRVLTLDVHLPFDVETKLGTENAIKISLNKDGEQSNIRRGFQSHVHNHMFMFSDNNGENIKKMCAECQPITIVTDRENIHNTEILSEKKVGDVKYEHALFDCERNITTDTGMAYLKDKFTNPKMNILTAVKYWRVYDRIFADRGMCGIGLWYEMHGKTSNTQHEHEHDSKKGNVFCEIGKDYVIDIRNAKVNDKISGDWKFYAGECDRTCKWSISVKKVEGDTILGVQLKHLNDVVEIYPQQGYQVWVNGKVLKHLTTGYFDGSWFNYKVLGQENMMILRAKDIGVQIQHDGNSIKLSLPEKLDNLHTGLCYGVSKLSPKV